VLTAEYSGLASTYNKLGHHGLFADRLDAGYQSATLAAGFVSSTHLPARIVYQVRNRTYDPSTQRWLQRDPNATGQVVLGSLASGGQAMSGAVSAIELTTLYGDGMSLYGYVRSEPIRGRDASGLWLTLDIGMSSGLRGFLMMTLMRGAVPVAAIAPKLVWATDPLAVREQIAATLIRGANLFAELSDPLVRTVTDPFRDFFDVVFSAGDPVRRPTASMIDSSLNSAQAAQHGDPNKWKYKGDKRDSGDPGARKGDMKIYEIWWDEFGKLLEVHYHRDPGGYVLQNTIKVKPYSL